MTVNGESKEFAEGMTLARLLEREGFEPGRVAVERNGEIVPKASYGQVLLGEEDKIEVVSFVGGG